MNINSVEDFVKNSTVVSYQAEGFSAWVLTQYTCSKYHVPFVNVARKGNSRTTLTTKIFNYRKMGDVFNIENIDFKSFGIPEEYKKSY